MKRMFRKHLSKANINIITVFCILVLLFIVNNSYGQSPELVILAEPSDAPAKILISDPGEIDEEELNIDSYVKNKAKYIYQVSGSSEEVFLKYYLSALDSNTKKKITDLDIWIPKITESSKIMLVLRKPMINEDSIREFSSRGLRGPNAYRTYFESKTIVQQVTESNPEHYLAGLASYWWFASAYELAKRKSSVIPMDKKAIDAIQAVIRLAENNRKYRRVMAQWKINIGHLKIESAKARRIIWKGYLLVNKAAKKRKYDIALEILNYYETLHNGLPPDERKKVLDEYGVYSKSIGDDKTYLRKKTRLFMDSGLLEEGCGP